LPDDIVAQTIIKLEKTQKTRLHRCTVVAGRNTEVVSLTKYVVDQVKFGVATPIYQMVLES
jgi:hypothetical protein